MVLHRIPVDQGILFLGRVTIAPERFVLIHFTEVEVCGQGEQVTRVYVVRKRDCSRMHFHIEPIGIAAIYQKRRRKLLFAFVGLIVLLFEIGTDVVTIDAELTEFGS